MAPSMVQDIRHTSPIASRPQVATLLHVPPSRLSGWTRGRKNQPPMVHTAKRSGHLTVPLVGIAEAASLHALRTGGMSMQEARRAADFIRREYNDEYAIASPHIFTDGTETFVNLDDGLARLRDMQGAFQEVLSGHLRPLIMGPDGVVQAYRVEELVESEVTIDPRFNAGRMSFTRNRVPIFAVAGALQAGEKPQDVASDFDLTEAEVADVERHQSWLTRIA